MNDSSSPFEMSPPTARRLLNSVALAVAAAAVILVLFVLPAEFGIDPTGLGKRMGLTALGEPVRTLEIKDVIGGNEKYRQVTVPDAGQPIPLPNPAVSQIKQQVPQTRTLKIVLPVAQETEVKAVLDSAQVILYSWQADGDVYTDFHGHEPKAGDNSFVRYEEKVSGRSGNGSLVAPFSGEHGWYWVNMADTPVTITLTVSGYFNNIVDYGLLR